MRSSLGLRGAPSWRSSWMLIASECLWIQALLLSCLMAVASEWSRRLMRFPVSLCWIIAIFHFPTMVNWRKFEFFWCFSFLQLEMEDGDEIDAMLHQTGGAFSHVIHGGIWNAYVLIIVMYSTSCFRHQRFKNIVDWCWKFSNAYYGF